MTKYLLLALLGLTATGLIQAQSTPSSPSRPTYAQAYQAGTWLVGGQGGYSAEVYGGYNVTAQVYGGYFLAPKLLVGISASSSRDGYGLLRNVAYSIGPVVRYQLTRTRFSPFLVASYQRGQRTFKDSPTQFQYSQQIVGYTSDGPVYGNVPSPVPGSTFREGLYSGWVGVGLSMGLSPWLKLDLGLNWQTNTRSVNGFTNGLYQPQLGLNYWIGGKK